MEDLAEVRQLISSTITDEGLRRKLLRLAGAAPQVWIGCSRNDVVGVLLDELADRERSAAHPPQVYSVPPATAPQVVQAQPSIVTMQQPAPTSRGPRLGSAILTGMVAGRVAGRAATRTVARRRF